MPPHILAVVGLGYVGLPLAVALANHFDVIGFDLSAPRIAALRQGEDRTGEVPTDRLQAAQRLRLTDQASELAGADLFIATVPTPVTADNQPDLAPLRGACQSIGAALRPGAIVVFESTVYPGVTEDVCGPWLEQASGLVCGRDFFLGYSPERINPGDREHGLERITKVIAGQTPAVTETLRQIYGPVTGGNLFAARDIKTAEAAKVIENAQRDINIAFINEVTMIFAKLGLSVHDVLAAARTKWNFLPFTPGLVGGHCIGVDPYYLAACARQLGHDPAVILAGRRINDSMADWLAEGIHDRLPAGAPVTILGLTFKEDVPDLRNSKVADLVRGLAERGHPVSVSDPLADPDEALAEYGIALAPTPPPGQALVLAVPHRAYRDISDDTLLHLCPPGGLIVDLKAIWSDRTLPADRRRWQL